MSEHRVETRLTLLGDDVYWAVWCDRCQWEHLTTVGAGARDARVRHEAGVA